MAGLNYLTKLKIFIVLNVIILLIVLYYINVFDMVRCIGSNGICNRDFLQSDSDEEKAHFLVETPGCHIPFLEPWDKSIKKFIFKPKPIKCNINDQPILTWASGYRLYFDIEAAKKLDSDIRCCFKNLTRVNENLNKYSGSADNKYMIGSTCVNLTADVDVADEFIVVNCTGKKGSSVYLNFHSFLPRKEAVEELCKNFQEKLSFGMKQPSVLIIGNDAISRLNLIRQMPETYQYLMEDMGAIDMQGYTKIGDNTFPNLVVAMSGHTEKDLSFCWSGKSSESFDHCPWIWKNYSQRGYRTIYGEDAPWMGIFHYNKVGFVQQPTDYYLRPLMKASEEHIGWKWDFNSNVCQGPSLSIEVIVNYTRQIATTFSNDPYFALAWTASLSHDHLNYPSMADPLWKNYLVEMNENGSFHNAFLIFMSDHGIRWGDIRNTYQGRIEERMPYMIIVPPKWFRQEYPSAFNNLKTNQKRLTTPFDLHKTLIQILNLNQLRNVSTVAIETQINKSYSFFHAIPLKRTCQDSSIEEHWCVCRITTPLNKTSLVIQKAVNSVIQSLNAMFATKQQCAILQLDHIIDSYQLQVQKNVNPDEKDKMDEYLIIFETRPGAAQFESSVKYDPKKDSFDLVGSISRINIYGNQSHCVDEPTLKKYCYCSDLL